MRTNMLSCMILSLFSASNADVILRRYRLGGGHEKSAITTILFVQPDAPPPSDCVPPISASLRKDDCVPSLRTEKGVRRSPHSLCQGALRRVPPALDGSGDCFPRRGPARPVRDQRRALLASHAVVRKRVPRLAHL